MVSRINVFTFEKRPARKKCQNGEEVHRNSKSGEQFRSL
ncbi:hypothetical protein SAMN05421740_102365 [Parapedobacter koreensis]|uniref:Uncharacterized protein n=1 Tax=Parapedobacter koreensis TaxID=332977 RepID=A0A1H7IYW3_9SPHI|nr:hypothetical protein SAMN05421740_102365 [Parapedobacter koreensis]